MICPVYDTVHVYTEQVTFYKGQETYKHYWPLLTTFNWFFFLNSSLKPISSSLVEIFHWNSARPMFFVLFFFIPIYFFYPFFPFIPLFPCKGNRINLIIFYFICYFIFFILQGLTKNTRIYYQIVFSFSLSLYTS